MLTCISCCPSRNRKSRLYRKTAALLVVVALMNCPQPAIAEYEFTKIREIPDENGAYGSPEINASGVVAFRGLRREVPPEFNDENFGLVDDHGELTLLPHSWWQPRINDSGVVAYRTREASHPSSGGRCCVFATDGTTIAVVDDPIRDIGNYISDYSNNGEVAFEVGLTDGTVALVIGDGGELRTIADTNGPYREFRAATLRMSPSGIVTFAAWLDSQHDQSLFRVDNEGTTQIAGPGFPVLADEDSDVNDSGTVLFRGWSNLTGQGIFLSDGHTITTVVDSQGPYFTGFRHPILNAHGDLAFEGLAPDQGGIYTGADPIRDKVIRVGDMLFGAMVDSVGNPSINDRGDIAFDYHLTTGRSGIALARFVPEPGGAVMLVLGGVLWVHLRRMRISNNKLE